jgi:peptide/nickel transport system substrate-binding protein
MRTSAGAAFRRILVVVLLLLSASLALSVAVAVAAGASSPAPSTGSTLRIGWTLEPDNLNPFIGYQVSNWVIWQLNYDTLVGFRASDLSPVPRLAISWNHSPDGKVWTFNLRRGVKWQDDVPFTSRDVAFTYNYIIKNKIPLAAVYTESILRVVPIDDFTVKFICSKPKANMLNSLVPILPQHIWSKMSPKAAVTSYPNSPPLIGTGPFQVVKWVKGSYIELRANKSYWGPKPKVDDIIFALYQNSNSMASDLKTGALQGAWDVPAAQLGPLGQQPHLTAIGAAINGFYSLDMNCYAGKTSLGNPVLRDPAFRTALQWAVDKQRIADIAYFGHADPASTLVRANFYHGLDWHWQPPANLAYNFDLVKAGQLLTQAGYPLKGGVRVDHQGKSITLRLWAPTSSVGQQVTGKLLAGWFRALGLKITFQVLDDGTISARTYNFTASGGYAPDFDMQLLYAFGDPDPTWMLSLYTTSQIGNWSDTGWSNAAYDRLYAQQQTTMDPQKRQEPIWQMQQIVYAQSPSIVLVYPSYLEAYNSGDWGGWIRSPEKIGDVIFNVDNSDNYISVRPFVAQPGGGGFSSSWVIAVVGVVLAAVVILIVVLRRRRRAVEEE